MRWKVMAFLFLTSCMTPEKFQDWAQKHPGESARICSDLYPVRPEYRAGKDSVQYLPVNVSVPGGIVGLYLPVRPAPDSTHRQEKQGNMNADAFFTGNGWQVTCRADSLQLLLDSAREIHRRVDTQLLENTARVKALQADSTVKVRQLDKATTRGDNLLKWVLYLAGGMVLLLGWTFRAPILGLIKKLIA